jgi:hypothetical protein
MVNEIGEHNFPAIVEIDGTYIILGWIIFLIVFSIFFFKMLGGI